MVPALAGRRAENADSAEPLGSATIGALKLAARLLSFII